MDNTAHIPAVVGLAATVLFAGAAAGQISCLRPGGPDLMVSDLLGVTNVAAAGGRDAFMVGLHETNVGSAPVNYMVSNPNAAKHPAFAQGLYRLRVADGATRIEEIGQSWVFHAFFALNFNQPCPVCTPGDGAHLGVGCTTSDTSTAIANQPTLGPRWQVNAWTGGFTYPPINPPFAGTIARRLQVAVIDLDPAAQYFVEVDAVAQDDAAAGSGGNNASYRPCALGGGPDDFTLTLAGTTVQESPAIAAWRAADPGVTQTTVRVPGEGTFIVASRATALGAGMWRYEYAVYNLNSDIAVGSLLVPVLPGVPIVNVGFHDVDYTDGDGIGNVTTSGEDWPAARGAAGLSWATTPFATDPNANAIRWGTLYNFRFDAPVPPDVAGRVTLGLWKSPGSLDVAAQTPALCYANCDGSTAQPVLNVNDFTCYLNRFAAGDSSANCDGSSAAPVLNVADFVCFLNQFAAGCP